MHPRLHAVLAALVGWLLATTTVGVQTTVTGSWEGALTIGTNQLPLTVVFRGTAGVLSAGDTMIQVSGVR